MVKIAVAGGSSEVGREIIDALVATGKHDIITLVRKPNPEHAAPGLTQVVVDYDSRKQLSEILQGVHTVLSFMGGENMAEIQKNLIDASISAGVKRFAPSDWATSDVSHIPWYAGKAKTRAYLTEINTPHKVLEYCLFQPGWFVDYLAVPHRTSKHMTPIAVNFDFANFRALVVDGHLDDPLTMTLAKDLAAVVVRAVEFEGEWPIVGGISGNRVTARQIIELGEKIRGKPFTVEKLKIEDLERKEPNASWLPPLDHPSLKGVPADQMEEMKKGFWSAFLLSVAKGSWTVSNEWNQLLPDLEFTDVESFLREWWGPA
ncbi:hypothetical protein B0H66DRAFT_596412 [Apodospora peruviana]|uniref:NmrA-like domain-containing protein n=1 Tax=Apodospora peruviana TaxID=516989 RepID=A0AAE0IPY7_9PEZI|nr:hypothetical protein B0H66DRAFT_596412 [Apodospora peruviana]